MAHFCRFALRNPHLESLKPKKFACGAYFPLRNRHKQVLKPQKKIACGGLTPLTRAPLLTPSRTAPTRSQIWPVSENNGGDHTLLSSLMRS